MASVFTSFCRVLLGCSAVATLAAQTTSTSAPTPRPTRADRRVYVSARLQGDAPRIDGQLDDSAWQLGSWAGDFVQRSPTEGAAPTEPTEVKVLYDDTQLYVAIRAYDSQIEQLDFIRGQRDEFTGDIVGIALDSYFDQRTSFQFNVTAGGSKMDLVITNDDLDPQWNAVWDVRTSREADAWTAEFAIPFSQLRYASTAEPVWGLHVWRRLRRNFEESNWQLIPRDTPAFVNEYGELHGIRDLRPARQIEVVPYLVAQYNTHPAEPGNPFRTGDAFAFDFGADAKIGVTNDFTLDLTVNPDFGQVEADPSEVNLSSFESFFPEQRPFFLEGRRLFDFSLRGDQLFYSRRIGGPPSGDVDSSGYVDAPDFTRILGAAKLTGKSRHGTAVGLLYAATAEEEAVIDEASARRREVVEPATHYTTARVQQDFANGATVLGGMLTGVWRPDLPTQLDDLTDLAVTGGFDWQHRWGDREYFFNGAIIGSHVAGSTRAITTLMENSTHQYQRPDAAHLAVDPTATSLEGWGGEMKIGRDAGSRWRYEGEFSWKSPGLELNDLGFMRRADEFRPQLGVDYVVDEPGAWWREYRLRLRSAAQFEWNGVKRNHFVALFANGRTNHNWRFETFLSHRGRTRAARRLRGGPSMLMPERYSVDFDFVTDTTRNLQFTWESDLDVEANSPSLNWEVGPGVRARVKDFLNVEAGVSYQSRLEDLQWVGDTADSPGPTRYIVGRMQQHTLATTLRLDVNFSARLSLAYFGSLFGSSGTFADFKRVTDPLSNRYEDRFERLEGNLSYDAASDLFTSLDDTGAYTFENPDFDVRELQSNLVLRWEYRPGSNLYVVWTQNRANDDLVRAFDDFTEYDRLFRSPAENTFLVKLSYWFSI